VGFIPLVAVWLVLALSTQSPHAIVGPTIAIVVVMVFVMLARRR
jgi:MFS superfamily sulfate permease-like transporter